MACKLPNCYPVSVDINDMEKLFKNKNSKILENFHSSITCPPNYTKLSVVDPNLQDAYAGSGTTGRYFINPNGGGIIKAPGLVGWPVIITSPYLSNTITGTIATHKSLGNQPGGGKSPGNPGVIPDEITFKNLSEGIPSLGHSTWRYNFCVIPPPPTPITNITTSNVTSSSFTLSWKGGVNGRTFTYSFNGQPITTNIEDNGATNSSANFSGLTPGTTYNIIVTTTNVTGPPQTGFSSIKLPTDCPKDYKKLSNLNPDVQATYSGFGTTGQYYIKRDGTIDAPGLIGWQALILSNDFSQNIKGTIDTHISLIRAPGARPGVSPVQPDQITFKDLSEGIPPSNYYIFCVKPPPPTPPTAITNIAVANESETSVVVTWSGGLNATSYTYKLNGIDTIPSSDNGVTSQSATFSGLTVGKTYVLGITATNKSGSITGTNLSVNLTNPTTLPSLAEGSNSNSSPQIFDVIINGIESILQFIFKR